MPAPTLEQVRTAGAVIHSMGQPEFLRRKTAEVGDALTAFFVILAKKLFPKDADPRTALRVELMLAAYFLSGSLAGTAARPPSESEANRVTQKVAGLDGAALGKRIDEEIGGPALAFFEAFSRQVLNETDDDRAKTVQLMVLAFLARRDL